jgi:integrase
MGTRKQAAEIKYLSQDELGALLKVIPLGRDRAIFLVAYRHGLRASEVGLLRIEDVDLEAERLNVHRLKGSLGGVHPIRPDERRRLKAHIKGRKSGVLFPSNRGTPISRFQLDHLMHQYAERAGISADKRHFHVLKHSVATHMLSNGAELHLVRDWLGHRSIKSTEVYARLINPVRDQMASRVFDRMPEF